MNVFPAINAVDLGTVIAEAKLAGRLIGPGELVHIDICDGKFTKAVTWNDPEDFPSLLTESGLRPDSFELHLMVDDPLKSVREWSSVGARFFVVHEEAVKDLRQFFDITKELEAEIRLSVSLTSGPKDGIELFKSFQVLAVPPGFAGQAFDERALEKINFLRTSYPGVKIEVDGGINPKTAQIVKYAGADSVVSASYIFGSSGPRKAYEELKSI